MATDTQISVTVPGDFDEKLSRYMIWLHDKGVRVSKAKVIIELAILGYGYVEKEWKEGTGDG